jgi:hypothetical protein
MKFSASTGGFYCAEINGDNIPADAVEITDAEHAALLHGQSQGERIVADAAGRPVLQAPTADDVKAAAWGAIKAERDRRILQGGYQVGAHWYHSDTFSRTQQLGLVMLGANLPANVKWKTMGGAKVDMTQALAQQVFGAAAASDIAIFAVAETHKAAMEASADPAAYDFSGGWPPAFGD